MAEIRKVIQMFPDKKTEETGPPDEDMERRTYGNKLWEREKRRRNRIRVKEGK